MQNNSKFTARHLSFLGLARVVKSLQSLMPLALLLFVASGCVLLNFTPEGTPQENQVALKKLIEGHDYHKALIYLDKIKEEMADKDYQAKQQRIKQLVGYFESDVEEKSASLAELGDLLAAITIVEQAVAKLPESVKLAELSSNLRQEQQMRLAENERIMLLSEAGYLLARDDYFSSLAKVKKPSRQEVEQLRVIKKQLDDLHPGLLECGQQTFDLGQYDIAEECLRIAQQIINSELAGKLLARLDEVISTDGDQPDEVPIMVLAATKKAKPAAALAESFLEIETKLKKEIDQGELLAAYDSLAKIETYPDKGAQAVNYRKILDELKAGRIARQQEEGAILYRRGKISQARTVWQQILLLEPENVTVREKIVRAEKVLKSVQDLQKEQNKNFRQ